MGSGAGGRGTGKGGKYLDVVDRDEPMYEDQTSLSAPQAPVGLSPIRNIDYTN